MSAASRMAYAFVSVLAVTAGNANAQQTEAPRADAASNNEIIVTARKTEERLIDVPAAVSVVTNQTIENAQISNLSDISSLIPNVRASEGSLSPGFTIRGISSASGGDAGFPPAVGVYVDEVFLGRDRAFNTVLADIERVEVLRGPQGTLYGKNTIAGTINVITRRPGDEFRFNADAQLGNYDYQQFRASISGPIIPGVLAAGVTAISRERDGYIRNATTGQDLNNIDAEGYRATAVFTPSSALTVVLAGDYYQQSDITAMETWRAVLPPIAPFNTVPAQFPTDRVVNHNTLSFAEREIWGGSLRVEYDISPNLQFTSITASREYTSDGQDDSDGLPLDQFNVGRVENTDNFSQEFRLSYAGPGALDWIAGVYYYSEDIESLRRIRVGPQFPIVLLNPLAPPLPPTFVETARTDAYLTDEAWAVYGSFNYDLTDQLTLSGGLRYTDEERTVNYRQYATQVTPFNIVSLFAINVPPLRDSRQDAEWTGDLSLRYSFSSDTVGYIRYARGFKAGGFLAEVLSPPPFTPPSSIDFAPEFVNSYEAGFRTTLVGGRLTIDLSAYYLDFTDKQEKVNTGISYIISNAAEAESQGFEGEFTFRLTDYLTLSGSFGFLDAQYTSFPNAGGLGVSFSGRDLVSSPPFSGQVALQYDGPSGIADGVNLFARAEVVHSDALFTDTANSVTLQQNAYDLVNARIGLYNGHVGAYLWGRNLTNEDIIGGGVQVFSVITRSINIPRTYGIELRYQY
ncbi:MAG: TonB-dependent receptor [Hyphomonadaceae bacterium]|nr:TonB-dependent receptor [Hyphomonadaceae bacterium]MBX3511611.1 TonB-dependent receptor [Hyphomonadaceae bacterium]